MKFWWPEVGNEQSPMVPDTATNIAHPIFVISLRTATIYQVRFNIQPSLMIDIGTQSKNSLLKRSTTNFDMSCVHDLWCFGSSVLLMSSSPHYLLTHRFSEMISFTICLPNNHQMKCSWHTDIISIEIKCTAERALNCSHVMWCCRRIVQYSSWLRAAKCWCGRREWIEMECAFIAKQKRHHLWFDWFHFMTQYTFVFNCLILFVKQSSLSE